MMDQLYNEEMLERVERYLVGSMLAEEQKAFEAELESNEELRQLTEQHRILVEGLQFAAFREDKKHWQQLQGQLLKEDPLPLENSERPNEPHPTSLGKRTNFSLIWLAIGLLGGLFFTYLFTSLSSKKTEEKKTEKAIANDDKANDEEILMGFSGERVQRSIPYQLLSSAAEHKVNSSKLRPLVLHSRAQMLITYQLDKDSLHLYVPSAAMPELLNDPLEWIEVQNKVPSQVYLLWKETWFPLFIEEQEQTLGGLTIEQLRNK